VVGIAAQGEAVMIPATTPTRRQLALLLGIPHPGEVAMHHDIIAMYRALLARGFLPEQILSVGGPLDRQLLLQVVTAVGQRIATWPYGEILLYVTSHGFYTGDSPADARVGIELLPATDGVPAAGLYWDEIWIALDAPPGVEVLLLPDH
jgi:hypothetical protein